MKKETRHLVRRMIQAIGGRLPLSQRVDRLERKVEAAAKGTQIALLLEYRELMERGRPLPRFEDIEFRVSSQNGEDGILLLIFAILGTTNKRAVEICAGDGIVCNTANLIVNHGWSGLLFDGNEECVTRGREFYSNCRDTSLWPPRFVHAWITAENVDSLITGNGFEGVVDLLSLDMDGIDYWIWRAVTSIRPRVVVLEYNNLWGPDPAVTVPYRPDFVADRDEYGASYCGASLSAFVKLGKEKGYRLVGCEKYNFNAFFVRSGIGEGVLPEVPVSACFGHPFAQFAIARRLPGVLGREWVAV